MGSFANAGQIRSNVATGGTHAFAATHRQQRDLSFSRVRNTFPERTVLLQPNRKLCRARWHHPLPFANVRQRQACSHEKLCLQRTATLLQAESEALRRQVAHKRSLSYRYRYVTLRNMSTVSCHRLSRKRCNERWHTSIYP